MTVSLDSTTAPTAAVASNSAEFGRTALAILVTMMLLIVGLTGILVQTTWHQPAGQVEVLPSELGSVARR